MCQSFKGVSFSFRVFFGKDGLGFFRSFEQRKKNISSWGNKRKGCSSHRELCVQTTPARKSHQSSLIEKKRTQPNTTHQTTVIIRSFFFLFFQKGRRERERERELKNDRHQR